jgi:hypothetical protein
MKRIGCSQLTMDLGMLKVADGINSYKTAMLN